MKKQLTPRQQKIYNYLLAYSNRYGYPPTVREIAAAVGLSSPSTVHFHLKALEEAGLISRERNKNRALVLPREKEASPAERNRVPLLGSVAAGVPIWADELLEDYVPFDLHGSREEHYALTIRGVSMINAGILDGDTVIVRRQSHATHNDIVIALKGDSATCKRFLRQGDKVILKPENDAMPPFDGSDYSILGKVIGVVRSY